MGILWDAVQRSCFPSLLFVGLGLLGNLSEWGRMLLADRRFVFSQSSYLCGIFS